MPIRRRTERIVAALAGAVMLAGCNGASNEKAASEERPPLGLFTTLPIYWGEVRDVTAMLDTGAAPHWARTALEEDYRLVPLDVLTPQTLAAVDRLLLAQPRALAPEENVALDTWVRDGGEVLVLADPMLVQESAFPIGDKRRPQDVVLLSPILARWGLDLRFDERQGEAERTVTSDGIALPVAMAGLLVPRPPAGGQGQCTVGDAGLIASCAIGDGRAVVVADADLLDQRRNSATSREALSALTERAFAD